MAIDEHYIHYFKDRTVFLTGATGGLGGCILYKLVVMLGVRKIYVLSRGPAAKAKIRIAKNMQQYSKDILAQNNVTFVMGNIEQPQFGLSNQVLAELEEHVQLVIHSAANISFAASLKEAVTANCLPVLELASMLSRFRKLELFVQISSAYCNIFLPDGLVEEKIYPLGDAEAELKEGLTTSSTQYLKQFAAPYYYSKHLMERLLTQRYPELPLLIIRPTCIAEALRQPFPGYGPEGSCPLTTFFIFYLEDPGNAVWHVPPGRTSGTNVFDVITVDWTANLTLLHAVAGTRGIVHAGAESYQVATFDQLVEKVRRNVADEIRDMMPPFQFVQDTSIQQCLAAQFFKIGTRDWRFSNQASQPFTSINGPLSITRREKEGEELLGQMVTRIAHDIHERRRKEARKFA